MLNKLLRQGHLSLFWRQDMDINRITNRIKNTLKERVHNRGEHIVAYRADITDGVVTNIEVDKPQNIGRLKKANGTFIYGVGVINRSNVTLTRHIIIKQL